MIFFSRSTFLALCLLFTGSTAWASSTLSITRAWSPEAPPVVKVLAAYMILENTSTDDVKISAIHSPDFNKVEIHHMESKNGMMHMQKQDHLSIPAGKVVSLQPGELHIMLIGPHKVFRDGDTLQLTLELNNGQQQTISVPVRKHNF